jgi:prolyl 3-hydroxylase /prolyl 3,4-dihydroxylase
MRRKIGSVASTPASPAKKTKLSAVTTTDISSSSKIKSAQKVRTSSKKKTKEDDAFEFDEETREIYGDDVPQAMIDENENAVFAKQLNIDTQWKKYKNEYERSAPYPHINLHPLCNESLFQNVRDEIVGNLKTKYKETDLFKLYQTTDLANIDSSQPELSNKLPSLLKLRDALYSKKFREFVSKVTGCPELTDRVDMAASAYSDGCHLLCHDDVIGTRAVSFIIYFVDKDWTAEDGGALELYPLVPSSVVINKHSGLPQGIPEPTAAKKVVPRWNSMAMFNVQPGRSYHSVEEVHRVVSNSPRLSIQGWYHAPAAPKGAEMASINQLKTIASLNVTNNSNSNNSNSSETAPLVSAAFPTWKLSDNDIIFLQEYINPIYLEHTAIDSISDKYINNSYVELRNFLNKNTALKINNNLFMKKENNDNTLSSKNWKLLGPAHVQRYLQYDSNKKSTFVLNDIKTKLFESNSFKKLIHIFTGESKPFTTTNDAIKIRCFRKGMDYTLAHNGLLLPEGDSRLDCNLCFVDDGLLNIDGSKKNNGNTEVNNDKIIDWESGERGGFECYIAAENEDNEAAEVYKHDNDDEDGGIVLSVSPRFNTLSLALRDDGTMRFIKYVSSVAPSNRYDISTSFCVDYSDDEEEEDDEKEEALD